MGVVAQEMTQVVSHLCHVKIAIVPVMIVLVKKKCENAECQVCVQPVLAESIGFQHSMNEL